MLDWARSKSSIDFSELNYILVFFVDVCSPHAIGTPPRILIGQPLHFVRLLAATECFHTMIRMFVLVKKNSDYMFVFIQ